MTKSPSKAGWVKPGGSDVHTSSSVDLVHQLDIDGIDAGIMASFSEN